MTTQLSERIDQLTRSRVPVRAGDGRARPGAELGARRATGRSSSPTARSRASSAVSALPARCAPRPSAPWRPGSGSLLRVLPDVGRRLPADAGCEHRGEPVPVRRSVGDLPRAAAARRRCCTSSGRRRRPRRSRRSRPLWASSSTGPATGARPDGAVAAVVSSHGGDEPAAIRAALDAGVGFVGRGLQPHPGRGAARGAGPVRGGAAARAPPRRRRHRRPHRTGDRSVDPGRGRAPNPARGARGFPRTRVPRPSAPGRRPGLRHDRHDRSRHRRTPWSTASTTGSAAPGAATGSCRTGFVTHGARDRRGRRAGRRRLAAARPAQAAAGLDGATLLDATLAVARPVGLRTGRGRPRWRR